MDDESVWSLLQCAFPGFTDRALEILSVAREQAETLHHKHVTPEHMLQALAAVEPGVGSVALKGLGVDFGRDVAQNAALVPVAPAASRDDDQSFSEAMERLLAQAKDASEELGHRYVGTEHLVLGLLRCGPCPAGDYLRGRGITVERFREQVLKVLAG